MRFLARLYSARLHVWRVRNPGARSAKQLFGGREDTCAIIMPKASPRLWKVAAGPLWYVGSRSGGIFQVTISNDAMPASLKWVPLKCGNGIWDISGKERKYGLNADNSDAGRSCRKVSDDVNGVDGFSLLPSRRILEDIQFLLVVPSRTSRRVPTPWPGLSRIE